MTGEPTTKDTTTDGPTTEGRTKDGATTGTRTRAVPWYVWRIIAFGPRLFALVVALVAFTYLMPLIPPLIVRELVDGLSGHAEAGWNVPTLIAAVLVVAIVDAGAHVWQAVSEARQGIVGGLLIRQNVFQRMLRRRNATAMPVSSGEALNRFRSDATEISETVLYSSDPIGQAITAVVAFVVMWSVSPTATLLVVLPLCVVLASVHLFASTIRRFRRRRQEATDRVTSLVNEALVSVNTIKVAGAEARTTEELVRLNHVRRTATLRDVALSQSIDSLSRNLSTISSGLILLLLADRMRQGTFTAGDFVLFGTYMYQVSELIANFGDLLTRYRQSAVSAARLLRMVPDERPDALVAHVPVHLTGPLPPSTPDTSAARDRLVTVEARGLTYRYPAGGIENIDLTLPRGSFTVVTGRVGSGKTTLLRVLLGLLPADAGTVRWNREVVADPGSFMLPPRVAYTPQTPSLLSMSLRDNICLGTDVDPGRLDDAVHAAVLETDVERLDQGLDTLVGPRGVKLSGGQMQRTAAARMFVRDAELLVMDDLSSALDVTTEQQLWDRLFARPDVTSLVVSHRPMALRRADRIIVLDEGRIAETGTLDELLARPGSVLRQLWHEAVTQTGRDSSDDL